MQLTYKHIVLALFVIAIIYFMTSGNNVEGLEDENTVDVPIPSVNDLFEQIMQDLLWSDPSDEQGAEENSRGAGCLFGPDVTANFLKTNKFKTIIRSHELVDDGYDIMHDDQCYTLFSASNYCGDAGKSWA